MIRPSPTSIRVPLAAAFAMLSSAAAQAAVVSADHLDVELVSEHDALVPGRQAWLGLRLRHAPHWHSYWINPGDSGLPTRLAWTLPAGFRAGDIAWPAPARFAVGGLYNFGYDGDVLLPIAIDVPADVVAGEAVEFAVEAKWLVCREECVPGKATLSLSLPVAHGAAPASPAAVRFAAARAMLPQTAAWTGTAQVDGERIAIALHGGDLPDTAGLDVFAVQRRVLDNAPPRLRREGDALLIETAKSDTFGEPPATLDLVLTNGSARAMQVRVAFASAPPAPPAPPASPRSPSP